jgi:hemerythrin-like domain-containing protein
MKITDAFRGEHGVFYAQFDHIEEVLSGTASLDQVRAMAAFLASALAPHAKMEDELLFDTLGEEHRGGPIAEMYRDHMEIEGLIHSIGGTLDAAMASERLLTAIDMARAHFLKEEQIAFPVAEQVLSASTLHALGAAWAQRRAVEIVEPGVPAG